jgi:hypothetical protein
MATQTTWIIEQMSVAPQLDGQTDVVVTAAWRCTGINGQYVGTLYGSASFSLEQGSSFTPYDQLTQDQVLGWVWTTVDKTQIELVVVAQLNNLANPPVIELPLPWSN